jgi:hypothetical protein
LTSGSIKTAITAVRIQKAKNRSGGENAPRRINGNIDWEEVYSKYVKPIIADQIAPNTNRGLMYILESKGILKKSDYTQLTNHLVDWRKDGRIKWEDIADGSGRGVYNDFDGFQDSDEFVADTVDRVLVCGKLYRQCLNTFWRWYGQPHYIEIWTEKHAVVGTIAAHIKWTYVKVSFNRGNPGWGYIHDNCERLRKEIYYKDIQTDLLKMRKIHVWYLGDDDKYGRDMDRQIREQLDFFGLLNKIESKRVAIVPSQIEEYGLTVDFESGKGYEIDALNAFNPVAFKKLLLDHINPYFDERIHSQLVEKYPKENIDNMVSELLKSGGLAP